MTRVELNDNGTVTLATCADCSPGWKATRVLVRGEVTTIDGVLYMLDNRGHLLVCAVRS